jgi:cation diffusion facilitator CzcD-associated flavoprotein CzcO
VPALAAVAGTGTRQLNRLFTRELGTTPARYVELVRLEAASAAYKGMMLDGVPNFAFCVGYTNASWTLKADLVSEYVCRLVKAVDAGGERICVPVNANPAMDTRPLLDFAAGYVLRALEQLPKSGPKAPWRLGMNYAQDVLTLRYGRLRDGVLKFSNPVEPAEPVDQGG